MIFILIIKYMEKINEESESLKYKNSRSLSSLPSFKPFVRSLPLKNKLKNKSEFVSLPDVSLLPKVTDMHNIIINDTFLKKMSDMIKFKNTETEDKYKLSFFNYFDTLTNKDEIFDEYFYIKKRVPSSSTNGFISIVALKKDKELEFVLKTPKYSGEDDSEREYKISKELTRISIEDKDIPKCIAKTWASIKCAPNYTNINKNDEGLGKTACIKSNQYKKTHILMEYIKGETFNKFIIKERNENTKENTKEIFNILGIINGCLYILNKKYGFTHYDLHTDNIMIEHCEQKYKFNIDGNIFTFVSKYRPIFIDFGRTYIRPFKMNGEYINLSKIKTGFYQDTGSKVNIYKRFESFFNIKVNLKKTIKNIFEEFVSVKYNKKFCKYSLDDKYILLFTTILLSYFQDENNMNDINDKSLHNFIINKYFNKFLLDITPSRPNNITDVLKINLSVLDQLNNSDSDVYTEIFFNFPFVFPVNNFLSKKYIDTFKNTEKISGAFCINNVGDILKLYIGNKMLSKDILKKSTQNKQKHTIPFINILEPSKENKKLVSEINFFIQTNNR